MNSKRLLSTSQFHQIPLVVKNALHFPQNTFHKSNSIKGPKGASILATNLIVSYFDQGLVRKARIVFDEMPERDVVSWTAMITGYVSRNQDAAAWGLFCDMVKDETSPNEFTLSSVLKASKGLKCLEYGALIHGLASKRGLEGSLFVHNALMDMYATCCVNMDNACLVFRDIKEKSTVTWTALITGFTHRGDGYGGLQVFRQMLREEAEVNPYCLTIAVRASTSICSLIIGKQIQATIIKHGFQSDLPVINSILDMYCRCGCLTEASQYFSTTKDKDLITWNTLIAGYEKSDGSEALRIFSRMESEGFNPNCFTFTSVIAACTNLAALNYGQQVHGGITRRGFATNLALANALIDMYAKCGNITDSRKIFSEMRERNLVSWTSMMIGYGAHGYGFETVELFDEMVRSGIVPDHIVFMAVLSACSHAGLVDEGLKYFKLMTSDYKINPDHEIYGCVVDLLGRAGRVAEAYKLIESMPFKPDESIWGTLLGACKEHGLAKLGKFAAEKVLDLKPNMAGTYVMLSYIYAAEGKWGDFAKTRKLMGGVGNKKEAGRSWIEVRNRTGL